MNIQEQNGPLQKLEKAWYNLRSPKRSETFWGFLGVVLCAFCLLWLKDERWISAPDDYFLRMNPDGFKNYMTTGYHLRHDSAYVHYSGMNYPFGEHCLFTDNQPVITNLAQWWSRNVSDISEGAVGLVNRFQLFSFLLGAGVLFLLFRKMHLPVWMSGLTALGLTFLSPQFNRFDMHFGLSHIFFLPLLMYFLCRYEERESRRYQSLHIGLLVIFAAMLHFYNFGISALFLSLYLFYQVLRDFTWKNIQKRAMHWLVMVGMPFFVLNLWIHWSNYVPDRPNNPWGFLVYIGYWEGVFLPYENFPLYKWIDQNIIKIRRINSESTQYAGLVALFGTLWFLLFSRIRRFSKAISNKKGLKTAFSRAIPRMNLFPESWDDAAHHRVHKNYLRGMFFSSSLILLFACGFIFSAKGMTWLVDYMGSLRQFRGLGRFTWAFFYVINLLTFYVVWHYSRRYSKRWMRNVFCCLPLLVLGYEAFIFQKNKPFELAPNVQKLEIFADKPEHWMHKIDFKKYQALLPLPYYHMGSENIWYDLDFGHFIEVQSTAYHTGTPDMGVNMSRTSIGQTVKSVQLVSEPLETPAILQDMPDNRPLAVMVSTAQLENVRSKNQVLLSKAKEIYANDRLHIFDLPIDSLRLAIRAYQQSIYKNYQNISGQNIGIWNVEGNAHDVYFQSFDSLQTATRVFRGKGAFEGNMRDSVWVFEGKLPKGHYYINFWMYANADMGMNHELHVFENAQNDGHEIQHKHDAMRFHINAIVDGWALSDVPFEVREDNTFTRICLLKEGVNAPFYLDEILVKPADCTLWRQESGWLIRNNFWYKMR